MRKTGIGIAGCGASVWMHGPAIEILENVEPVAWMDIDVQAAKKASERFGGSVYTDYNAFLDNDKLDAVIIATPNWLHYPQVLKALEKGKHVLCEKPMTRTVSECRKILEFHSDTNEVLMAGFMKRFDPTFIMVNDMIKAGEIGEVYEISCDWGWPQYFTAGVRDQIISGGGLLIDHGSHSIDLARWWGGNIKSVYARIKIVLEGRQVEDYANVVCQHENGCVSLHNHSRLTSRKLHESYKIEGTKGCITVECNGQWSARLLYPFSVKLHKRTNGINNQCTDIFPQPTGDVMGQLDNDYRYSNQLSCFLDAIENDTKLEYGTAEDGYAAIEAINAAYISANEDRSVCLPIDIDYDYEKTFKSLLSKQQIKIDML